MEHERHPMKVQTMDANRRKVHMDTIHGNAAMRTRRRRASAALWPTMMALLLSAAACSDEANDPEDSGDLGEVPATLTPAFLSQDEAREEIGRRDEFVSAMSTFDLESRTGAPRPVAVEDYLRVVREHALAFSEDEKENVGEQVNTVLDRMAERGLRPPADPPEVRFVRTDGEEEGGPAAYTRSGTVFLCDLFFDLDPALQIHTVAHELFHIWSRANPDVVRWPAHEALGFSRVQDLTLPPGLADRKITNPDDPLLEEVIRVSFDGAPVDVALATIARSDYEGGSFFDYLDLWLVEPESGALHSIESAEGLFEQLGTTTEYILSAEEISAEHFALGLLQDAEIRDPELIEAVLLPFEP